MRGPNQNNNQGPTREQLLQQWDWATNAFGVLMWLLAIQAKNEKGKPLEWRDRRFLVEPLCDMYPYQVAKKCSQVGWTTMMLLKAYFIAMFLARAVIYSLPTDKLVQEISTTKLEPIESNNPPIVPTDTNNKTSKSWKKASYVLLRGTAGDAQDVAITADYIIADEVNHSDIDKVKGLESRLQASDIKAQWWFGHPTFPGAGVDEKWLESDQREWHVRCHVCGEEQPLDYWANVDKDQRIYVCRVDTCRAHITDDDRRNGRWIPTVTEIDGRPPKWHGYHVSHLIAPWISAEEVIYAEEHQPKDYFFSKVLGEPNVNADYTVDTSLIMAAALEKDDPRHKLQSAQKFMGVDVGAKLHVVIGNERGIQKVITLSHDKDIASEERDNLDSPKSKWGKLVKLMALESITMCVIDNGPAEKQVDFQKRFPFKVLRCIYDYKDARKEDWETVKDKGVIYAHRTRIIDRTIESYANGETIIYMDRTDPWLGGTGKTGMEECLTSHWSTLYVVGAEGEDKNIVKKDRMGNVIRIWYHAGPDHLAHANVYYNLARSAGRYLGTGTGGFMPGSATGGGGGKGKAKPDPLDDDDDLDDKPTVTFYGM